MKTPTTTLKQMSRTLLLPLFGLSLMASAQANVIFYDDFSDGNRNGWYSNSPDRVITVTDQRLVVPGVGYGTHYGSFLTYFDSTTLAVGETLTVAYSINNVSINSSPVRIGLFNSGGSQLTEDNSSITDSTFNGYTGYIASLNLSGSAGQYVYGRPSGNDGLWTLGSQAGNETKDFEVSANTFVDASYSIFRSDVDTVVITVGFNGNNISVTSSSSGFTYDTIGFLFGANASGERQFDYFEVTLIPEPAHFAALFGFGLLVLLLLRRRRGA